MKNARIPIAVLLAVALFWAFPKVEGAQVEEFRGFWVDAWGPDLWTSNAVSTVVNEARAANANALVCQVRRRADALYRISPFEPVCSDVEPGFDPLAELIARAHDTSDGKQRLEVHAWLVVYPAWHGTNTPPPDHPSVLHPEWLTRGNMGTSLPSFDPGHPKVQQHTFDVAMNIISNYNVDGINLDYIRYSGPDEGYNTTSQQRFIRQTGLLPPPASPTSIVWKQWRRDQVTALVRKIYLSAIALRPPIKISCDTVTWSPAAISDFGWTNSLPYDEVLQDWRAWMEEGIVDLCFPMAYFRQYDASQARDYADWIQFALDHQYQRRIVMGPGIHLNSVEDAIRQMRATRMPAASGNRAYGVCAYGFKQTNKDGVPRSEFLNALVNPSAFDAEPQPFFAERAECPVMPWKTAGTKGHLKGFIYGVTATNALDGAFFEIDGPVQRRAISDATGFYGLVDLEPGSYTLKAWASSCMPANTNFTVTAGQVTSLDVVLGQIPLGTSPSVLAQPENQAVLLGSEARLTVHAIGTPQLWYQWSWNGTNMPAATQSSLTLPHVEQTDSGTYRVVVTNSYGAVASSAAMLSVVNAAPTITGQPQSQTLIAGHKCSLVVGCAGALPLSWQWLLDETPIGNNFPTLVLEDIQQTQAGRYSVIVSNQFGAVTSATANISVRYSLDLKANGSGSVLKTPNAASYAPGSVVRISAISATNSNFVEWSGDVSGNQTSMTVTLTNSITAIANFNDLITVPDLVVDNVDPEASFSGIWQTGANDGKWSTNYRFALGSLTGVSNAIFRPVIPVDGHYNVFIWYNQGPNRATNAPWTVCSERGTETNFVNQQTNGSQWFKIASAQEFHAGTNGYVRVSNQIGVSNKVVMADAVKFVFVAPPYIADPPQPQRIVAGQSATFIVNASGGEDLAYTWRKNGSNVISPNGFWFQIASPRYSDAGFYDVVVSNTLGEVVSPPATLDVIPPEIRALVFSTNDARLLEVNWAAPETILEESADLTNWTQVPILTRSTNMMEFQDADTNSAGKFYRTRLP